MGWEDRHYYREGRSSTGNGALHWILYGSVPLFTAFGIRVRALSWLVITVGLVLLFGLGRGFTWQDRVVSMTALFLIVLLHEFGHCFACRWVGGEADEIVMHPLGGLALAQPPRRPLPTFITVAGGPVVNVVLCLIFGAVLYVTNGQLPWNPFNLRFDPVFGYDGWTDIAWYSYWLFHMSWTLLMFNLLPIFPLDGGQMLQSILWPMFGYYKSMNFACITGMVGAVVGGMVALATLNIWLAVLAMMGFMTCLQMRRALLAEGPYGFEDDPVYAATSYTASHAKPRRATRRAVRRAHKLQVEEDAEKRKIDVILAKVSAHGMQSLTLLEKRTLHK
ncbi:MAG: M50 family metallopeptidase, partial [Tepidisphaeraceae bacterium]